MFDGNFLTGCYSWGSFVRAFWSGFLSVLLYRDFLVGALSYFACCLICRGVFIQDISLEFLVGTILSELFYHGVFVGVLFCWLFAASR